MERPVLSTELDGATFRSFYYLKEELVRFCREHQLPAGGGKQVLTERIAHYLDTGEVPAAAVTGRKRAGGSGVLREDSVIETDFVCSERHRAFFREKIGPGDTVRWKDLAFQVRSSRPYYIGQTRSHWWAVLERRWETVE